MDGENLVELRRCQFGYYRSLEHDPGPAPGQENFSQRKSYGLMAAQILDFLPPENSTETPKLEVITPELEVIPPSGDLPAIAIRLYMKRVSGEQESASGKKKLPAELGAIGRYKEPEELHKMQTANGELRNSRVMHERFCARSFKSKFRSMKVKITQREKEINNLRESFELYRNAFYALTPEERKMLGFASDSSS